MNIYNEDEVNVNKNQLIRKVDDGSLFIYPTDTIYGIGCDATNEDSVNRIRETKNRYENPFTVIAPSKEWIIEHCEINSEARKWLDKLPGPYTLILKLKSKDSIASSVNINLDTIGVRIPDHWISKFTSEIGKPIITTSANKQGLDFMTSIENLDPEVKSKVKFIIYEGEIPGRPSTMVHLGTDKIEIVER